ncbi:MAG: ATP-grasp domain-containing protein [Candidatus Sifarchaeia archaeon]
MKKVSGEYTTSVLLTDGSFKHTLATVRSLGGHGLEVSVADSSSIAQSFFSKYCRNRYRIPRPSWSPIEYIKTLREILQNKHHDVLLPIGWEANYYISKYVDLLNSYTKIPIVNHETMSIAANKDMTMKYAKRVGITIPKTFSPKSVEEIEGLVQEQEFPYVVKGSTDSGHVIYAKDIQELKWSFEKLKQFRPIIQEYVDGYGCGFFALYDNGKCIAEFMHKRVREFPPTGGPSVAAMSYFSPALRKQGRQLLDSLKWHGVAMVEFKRDAKDGKYKLIEVNPKFWGSLELAMASGVDFPYLAYKLANEEKQIPQISYRKGVVFRWPFPGDFLNALSTHTISRFFSSFGNLEIHDDIRISDIGPLPIQLIITINSIRKRERM